jgi:uncharacterized phage infection (PIP) family protein YhgE
MDENKAEQTQLMQVEEVSLETMSLEEKQRAENLYHNLGLDPVVAKVLREYEQGMSRMDKATDRVFGPYDVKGRADAVAKVTALMTYAALSEQYSHQANNLHSQIDAVSRERDKEKGHYDNLVQKVADVVGEDYDALKTNYNHVVESLSDIEHLKKQTLVLNKEKADLAQKYESQIDNLNKEHNSLAEELRRQIGKLETQISSLESEKATLTTELAHLKKEHTALESVKTTLAAELDRLRSAAATLGETITYDELKERLGKELHTFLLKDSKVPGAVIDGVGKFIDFKKYLAMAVERGAMEATKQAQDILGQPGKAEK